MAQLKYNFPHKLEDLSHPQTDTNIFYVTDELTLMEIKQKMTETESDLNNDPLAIYSVFNVYYSVLRNFSELDPRVTSRFWVILYSTTSAFKAQLRDMFANDHNTQQSTQPSQSTQHVNLFENNDEKLQHSNALKMLVFITCSFIQQFEDNLASQSHRKNFEDKMGDGKRKKSATNAAFEEYDRYKVRALKELLNIISLPLAKIVDSPTEARDVAGQVLKVCYKLIENSAVNNLTKNPDLINICFSLLGFGIERYNQSLTFCLKFIQLLQQREQLAPFLAELVEFIVTKHDQSLLIGEIFREIDRIDIKDLSRDSSCPRAVSTFLTALSEKCPRECIQSIDHIFGYLEQDSYIMRNASLSILANLVLKVLHKEGEDKTMRDEILDALSEHIRDITGYTRSKALSLWCTLCENQCIPLTYNVSVLGEAVGRLRDKVCLVRKNAVRFITTILIRNPFAPRLPLQYFLDRYKVEKEILDKILIEEKEKFDKEEEVLETLSQNSQDTSIASQTDPNMVQPTARMKNLALTEESPAVLQQRKVDFLNDAIAFTRKIHQAIPLTSGLLYSKNVSDTQEAIDFFVTCHEYGIDEAIIGIKRMILLIDHQEKSIRDAVQAAYRRIFFESRRHEDKPNKIAIVVADLIKFVQDATIGECICLEKLIGQFVQSNDFTKEMEFELWAIYTRVKANSTNEEAIAAITLLGLVASAQRNTIDHNLHLCNKHGFAVHGSTDEDSRLVRETCIAIRKALPKKAEERCGMPRLARDDEMFVRLETILFESFTNPESEHWFSMCDEIIRLIYSRAEHPEKICESIITKLSDCLNDNCEKYNRKYLPGSSRCTPDTMSRPPSSQSVESHSGQTEPVCLWLTLARFLHLLGDVALTLAVYMETDVLLELKARAALTSGDQSRNNISMHNISMSSRRRSRRYGNKSMEDDKGLEEEVGLGGAEAEDVELEFIERICDEELVCGDSLLARMSKLVLEISQDPIKFHEIELRRASTLTLAKFMIVSAKFCHQHLRLLFTILEKSEDSGIKINLLIAVGDMCVRFPNLLEPWTTNIFDCLQNKDASVRRTALKILSRLVLNDILKPKENISAMAYLIVDTNEHIAANAKAFFLELSRKLNAIYNVLPDIISRLSDTKKGIPEEHFRTVMKFLMDLIDKSQQIERLVDKLCGRFTETDNERQWSDLAYCLSLLKYADKPMAKLVDKFDYYKDKLCIDSVRDSFVFIITNFKKTPNLKNETKQLLDDFESKIESVSNIGNKSVNQQEGEVEEEEQATQIEEEQATQIDEEQATQMDETQATQMDETQ